MACLRAVPHTRRVGHPRCSAADDVSPAGGAAPRTSDGRGLWIRWRDIQRTVSPRTSGGDTSLAQRRRCNSLGAKIGISNAEGSGLPGDDNAIDQQTATRREVPRNRRSDPHWQRNRHRTSAPSLAVASCADQSSSSLVITTSPPECFDLRDLRATAHDIDRAEAFRTSELQHKPAYVEPAAVWTSQSAGLRSCSTMVITQAVTGFTKACAASSSERSPGTGMTRSAGLTMSSRHEPQTFRRTTRVPGAGPATPDPSASTTPTHSMPGLAGSVG